MSDGTPSHVVNIDRLRVVYQLPADHGKRHLRKAQLDQALDRGVKSMLGEALDPLLASTGESVWLIRRVAATLNVNMAWQPDVLARQCARHIVREVARAVSAGPNGDEVMFFPDRAAYLAHFVADLAQNRAWSKWYYQAFAGLRPLPTSTALRTALLDDPAQGLAACLALTTEDQATVIGQLTGQDAHRLLVGLAADDAASAGLPVTNLWAVWEDAGMDVLADHDGPNALRLCLAAWRSGMATNMAGAPRAAYALLGLGRLAARRSASALGRLVRALADGNLADVYRLADGNADALLPLAQVDPRWVQRVAGTLHRRHYQGVADADAPTVDAGALALPRHTRLGGVFLLLPDLIVLPLEEWVDGWPVVGTNTAASCIRWLLLLKCLGQERARAAQVDPLLRDTMGVKPDLSLPLLAGWAQRMPGITVGVLREQHATWLASEPFPAHGSRPAGREDESDYLALPEAFGLSDELDATLSTIAEGVMRAFAWRLPGFAGSSLSYLYVNFLDVSAAVEVQPGQSMENWLVTLGKPPLHLILNMAGLTRRSYTVPWRDNFVLTLAVGA